MSSDGTAIDLSYTHPIGADDVIVMPEWSSDLTDWFPLGEEFGLTAIEPDGNGDQRVSLRSTPEFFAMQPRMFIRLSADDLAGE